jgi:hypothetical protein
MKKIVFLIAFLASVKLSQNNTVPPSGGRIVQAQEISTWIATEIPLTIDHDEKLGFASVQGYWQSTDPSKDKQSMPPVAVIIECTRFNKNCGVFQASVSQGVLMPEPGDYYIANWTTDGIVADDWEEGVCGLQHHLSLDFKSNTVTVRHFQKNSKNVTSGAGCQPFQGIASYTLHGGQVELRPPARWGGRER